MIDNMKDAPEMSVETKLKNLYSLQQLHTEIDRIKTLRGELPQEVKDLEDEIIGQNTHIGKVEQEIAALKHDIAERTNNIELNKANIERYKKQMDTVRNNREYDNLTKQIEYAELDNQLNEKKIAEAKVKVDEKTSEMTACNMNINDRRTALEIKKSELDEIVSETKAEEDKLREKAKDLEDGVEPRLLSAFKRIRKNSRNGLAVVYVQRDACGGCFNKIPPQRQLDIRLRKKVIVCEYCGRILIDPELAGVQLDAPVEEKKSKRSRRREED